MADEAAGALDDFDGAGEEYLYLLRPIRDLRRNWEEDICQHLKDYLDSVIEETGVFNFVRAAAVIIGNTNIYGKKVDYVHQLALNFFDQIKERQRRRQGGDSDDDDDGEETGARPEDGETRRKKKAEKRKQTLAAVKKIITELAEKSRPTLPTIPIAFTPLADYEKMDVPLYSRLDPSEVVGKKDDFKVNTFYIHQGVALADLKNLQLVDKFSYMGGTGRNTRSQTTRNTTRPMSRRDPTAVSRATAPSLEHPVGGVAVDEMEIHNDDWAGDDGTANDYADENLVMEEGESSGSFGLNNLYGGDGSQVDVGGDARRTRASRRTQAQGWEKELQIADPLEEKKSEKCVPFSENRKCCIEASKQVETREKKIENQCRARGVPNVKTLKAYIDSRMYSRRVKTRHFILSEFNSYISDQGQLAIAPLIFAEEGRRKKIRTTAPRGAERAVRVQSAEDSAHAHENGVDDPNHYGESAMDDGSGTAGIEHSGEMWMDNDSNLGDRLSVNDLENSLGIQNLYARMPVPRSARRRRFNRMEGEDDEVMVHNYDDTFYADGSEYPDELPSRPISQMEYEEVVAFHLRKYWSSTEENQTVFAERVRKWEEKMAPILDRELKHRNFDAREYGDKVMAQFEGEIGGEIDFTKILEEVPHYELSRYLLVTLILANTGNVEVVADQQAHATSPDNEVHLKLLKLERHHEVFEDEQRLMMGDNRPDDPMGDAR